MSKWILFSFEQKKKTRSSIPIQGIIVRKNFMIVVTIATGMLTRHGVIKSNKRASTQGYIWRLIAYRET